MNKGYYFEGIKYSKEDFDLLMLALQILKDTSEACEDCPKREYCIEEQCVLFKTKTIINELISEVRSHNEQQSN